MSPDEALPDAALLERLPPRLRPLAAELPARRTALALDLMDRRLTGLTVVAEAVHRRHNVSAILRSAEAFGVHEAHLVTGRFQPSRGAAKGAERWLELHLHERSADCIAGLRARGFRTYVADLAEDAVAPWELPVHEPLALLLGSELDGVSDEARAEADGVVSIPMVGVMQSLNVAAAAAILLHQACHARRAIPGARGVRGEAREAFLERFLLREHARRRAGRAAFGDDGEPSEDPALEGA